MCLITEQKEPFIAEEDIIVYKAMESRLRSFFQYFQYSLDEVFETQIKEIGKNGSWVTCCNLDGDYLTKKYGVFHVSDLKSNPDLRCYKYGFSSCESHEIAFAVCYDFSGIKMTDKGIFYKCIIPKGSEYFKDEVGFLISNKIIIKEDINELID